MVAGAGSWGRGWHRRAGSGPMVWVQGEACGARAVRSAGEGGVERGERGRGQWEGGLGAGAGTMGGVGSGGRGRAGEGLQADVTGGTEWRHRGGMG